MLDFPRRPDLILLIEGRNYSPSKFLEQITLDFDQLYEEAGRRRRMMSVSAHDRISGTPQMVRVWDEITRFALQSPLTLRETETI